MTTVHPMTDGMGAVSLEDKSTRERWEVTIVNKKVTIAKYVGVGIVRIK